MLDAGELPNLAAIRSRGGLASVATTYPAQTPVAWSTFATGTNPGGHGVFDFLRRDPQSYLPDNGLNRYEQKNAFLPPKAVNLRRGTPVWDTLAAAGIGSTVLRCPCTYPAEGMGLRGRMLSGMGVPDLRGGLGRAAFYSSAAGGGPGESEHVIGVAPAGSGPIASHLIGPRSPRDRSDLTFPIRIEPDPAGRRVVIRSDGMPGALEVRQGQW